MHDKRLHSRIPVEIPVEFTPWDPKHAAFGFVTDLSLAGATVTTEFPLPRGSHVVLRMWRPACEEIVVAGVVRWACAGRMGLELAPMPEATRDQLATRIATSRRASRSADPSPQRAIGLGTLTRILALVWATACGGLSTAGLLQGTGADGGRTLGGGTHIGEGGASPGYSDDASTVLVLTPSQPTDAQPLHVPFEASADAFGDAVGDEARVPTDGAEADRADLDADTSCGALAQCCGRLVVAPPLAAACYLSAEADGGAGTCVSTLATFRDSGLCP